MTGCLPQRRRRETELPRTARLGCRAMILSIDQGTTGSTCLVFDGEAELIGRAYRGHEQLIRERTGLVLDPYFSATKIEWLLEHVDGLRERASGGGAVFGTVDSWLIYKLCGEPVTDPSNASRTMLFDIAAGEWDGELLELFGVPEGALPRV